jgi:hypothetical protein
MDEGYDFKKEWPKIKKELQKVSGEAVKILKKGEEEVVKYSRLGKIHVDSAALRLKKEHLFHMIGKEYLVSGCSCEPSAKMKKYLAEHEKIEKQLKALDQGLKAQPAASRAKPRATVKRKRTAKKTSPETGPAASGPRGASSDKA